MLVSGQLYKAEEENELRMNMYIYVVYSAVQKQMHLLNVIKNAIVLILNLCLSNSSIVHTSRSFCPVGACIF